MKHVTVIQVVYNNRRFIEPVFSAIFSQTYRDVGVVAVISGNDDHGKELLMEKFPQVTIIDPGYNIGFAAGHNLVFNKYKSEFFQLVNPDLVLEHNYIEQMLLAFADTRVGAATGKLYQWDARPNEAISPALSLSSPFVYKIDTTGVTIAKSGRARDRGQHEVDRGQYDSLINVQAVSGAGPMFRRAALEATKSVRAVEFASRREQQWKGQAASEASVGEEKPSKGFPLQYEYFDEDFHSYWEDVDLSWRMANAGWKNVFVPAAVGYHGRGAASSKNGYLDVIGFIRHHKQISSRVKQLNYKNHILMYIKDSPKLYPQFFVREFFMFWYILIFETRTLKVLPQMLKLLPKMWNKRKAAQQTHA